MSGYHTHHRCHRHCQHRRRRHRHHHHHVNIRVILGSIGLILPVTELTGFLTIRQNFERLSAYNDLAADCEETYANLGMCLKLLIFAITCTLLFAPNGTPVIAAT
jgi:hypothetical protein